ncbi:unnamed protein product [Adineta ricciae]|uniref:RING-type domain-containing protein n=1 Tax=Adineta ricciae TaxID=249248 RepID=A0A815V5W2_ADIRI|nr:unnamed protein product [Adineta ricciae]CAF1523647.1 unnamed protein product [Adineta ricciae]
MATSFKFEYMNKNIDEHLKCPICKSPFIDPVSTPCRHAFCRQCINDKLSNKSSCPECNQSLSSKDLSPMVIFICKMLDDLLVKCVNCEQTGIKRSQFDHHLEEVCPKTLVSCSGADIRCPWTGRVNQLKLHKVSCDYERLRTILTELISENETLKEEKYLCEKSACSIEGTTAIAQLTKEVNFMLDSICHRNEKLEKTIKQFTKYSPIDLRLQKLTDLDMGIIVQKAIIDCQCTVLELKGNMFSDLSIPILIHGLYNNTSMTKLNLNHNPIGDTGVRLLAEFFAMDNTNIEKLYLGNINLTDQGVYYLAQMLINNRTLKALGIFENPFGDQGVKELARVFTQHKTSLDYLYMDSMNSITDASVDVIINMLNNTQSLQKIGMRNCGFSTHGVKRLKEGLGKNLSQIIF